MDNLIPWEINDLEQWLNDVPLLDLMMLDLSPDECATVSAAFGILRHQIELTRTDDVSPRSKICHCTTRGALMRSVNRDRIP
jgi:hypothetical protein